MRGKEKEGIFGEVGRGEWVGRGGAGGLPIWGGRFGWGTRGFLFVIGCDDFLFLNNGFRVGLVIGFGTLPWAWFSLPPLVFSRSDLQRLLPLRFSSSS